MELKQISSRFEKITFIASDLRLEDKIFKKMFFLDIWGQNGNGYDLNSPEAILTRSSFLVAASQSNPLINMI